MAEPFTGFTDRFPAQDFPRVGSEGVALKNGFCLPSDGARDVQHHAPFRGQLGRAIAGVVVLAQNGVGGVIEDDPLAVAADAAGFQAGLDVSSAGVSPHFLNFSV